MPNFYSSNKIKQFCILFAIVFVVAAFLLINFASSKHFYRLEIGKKQKFSLSDKSKNILSHVMSDVEIFVVLEKSQEYSDVFDIIQKDIRKIMMLYLNEMKKVKFTVEFINIAEQQKRYSYLCGRFGILPGNCVVIAMNNKVKVLAVDEFYKTHNGNIIACRGEQVVSNALRELSNDNGNVIYFLSGHGEHELDNVSSFRGLSALSHAAKQKNYRLKQLNLLESKSIPDDANLIVIVGARSKFLGFEKELLRDFIDNRHGKLVIAWNGSHDTGLKDFLGDYGIFVGESLLFPSSGRTAGYFEDLVINRLIRHKITNRLIEFRVPIVFGSAYEVKQAPWFLDSDKYDVIELVQSDDDVMQDTDDDKKNGINGPFSVAAMSVRKVFDPSSKEKFSGAILVVGSSDFISNSKFKILGNRMFWFGISDYLLSRGDDEAFSDVKFERYRLAVAQKTFMSILWKFVCCPLALLLLSGVVMLRRRK